MHTRTLATFLAATVAAPPVLALTVGNLAIPLTPTAGDEPEEDVTRWTVSRIKLPN